MTIIRFLKLSIILNLNILFVSLLMIYLSRSFYDDHATGFVFAMLVASHATIFAAVLWLAVYDLHRDDPVGVAHRIVILGQLFSVLVPFHGGRWIAAQAAEQLASLPDLNDTWSQQEGEAWRRLDHLQPHVVAERLSSAYRMQLRSILWNF